MKRLAFLALAAAFSTQVRAESVRLGIVSDPELRILADELTAKLSGETSVELVERDEMRRIAGEQNLARTGLSLAETIRLGQMVRADGLLVLRVRPLAEGSRERRLEASLLATGPGVLLASSVARGGKEGDQTVPDSAKVLGELKDMVLREMPKLRIPASEVIPLSLAHIKVGFGTGNRRDFEERLNAFMLHRLAAEPRFLVLERHNLELLAWEKDSTAGNPEAFRTGAVVLSGEVIEDLGDPESVTFTLKIQPTGAAIVERRIAGKKTALEALGEAATAQLQEYFNQPVAGAWNAEEEGKRFVESARRARAQGLDWRFVKGHADAAWALGYRQEPALRMKLIARLCEMLGFSYEVHPDDRADIIPATWERLERDFPRDAAMLERRVDAALETIGLFHSELATLQANKEWRRTGIEVAQILSHFLYQAHKHGAWTAHQPELDQVRAGLRKMLPVMISPGVDRQRLWLVEEVSLKHSAVWNESAAGALQAWREMLFVPRDEMKSSYTDKDQEREKFREIIFEDGDDEIFSIAGRETKLADFQAGLLALAGELRMHKDLDNRITGFLYLSKAEGLKTPEDAAFIEAEKLFEEVSQSDLNFWTARRWGHPLAEWMAMANPEKFRQFTVDWSLRLIQKFNKRAVASLRYTLDEQLDSLNQTQAEAVHREFVSAFRSGGVALTNLDINRELRSEYIVAAKRQEQTTLETSSFWPAVEAIEKRFPALRAARLAAIPAPTPATPGGGEKLQVTRSWPDETGKATAPGITLFSGWDSSPGWIARGDEFWFQQLIPSLEVIRLQCPGMEEERFPLPRPAEVADVTAFATLSLSSVTDRWIVMRRPGRVADWRLLVYDRQTKSWAKRGSTPCLTFQNFHHGLIMGEWFYSSYEDPAAGAKVAGLLRVHLTDGAVEFLTNSAGRGTLAGTNPPKLIVSRLAEIQPGVLFVPSQNGGDWLLHADAMTWEKFKGTPPPDLRRTSVFGAQIVPGPRSSSDNTRPSDQDWFLQAFDPALGCARRFGIKIPTLRADRPRLRFANTLDLLAELPSGIVFSQDNSRLLLVPNSEIFAHLKHLRETQPAPPVPQLAGLPETSAAAFVARVEQRETLVVRGANAPTRTFGSAHGGASLPAISPDGKRVAFGSSREDKFGVWLLDPAAGNCLRISPNMPESPLAWAPSNDAIAFWDSDTLKFIDLTGEPKEEVLPATKKGLKRFQPPGGAILEEDLCAPRWSPDGHFIAVPAIKDKLCQIFVVDLQNHTARCVTSSTTDKVNCAWSPDGKEIAFATLNGAVGVVNAETAEERELSPGIDFEGKRQLIQIPAQVSWSPDGGRLGFWYCVGKKPANGIITLADAGIAPVEPGAKILFGNWLRDGTLLYTIVAGEMPHGSWDAECATVVRRMDPATGKRTDVSSVGDNIWRLSVAGEAPR